MTLSNAQREQILAGIEELVAIGIVPESTLEQAQKQLNDQKSSIISVEE